MAKLIWIMERASGTVTHELTISEASMARIVNLIRSDRSQLSADDAVEKWMIGEGQSLKDRVINREGHVAAENARNNIRELN